MNTSGPLRGEKQAPKHSRSSVVGRGALQVALLFYAVIVAYPMVWLLLASVKNSRELFEKPWGLPASPQWVNFAKAWDQAGIGQCFLNSVFVTAVSMFFILLFGAMAAYGWRVRVPGGG